MIIERKFKSTLLVEGNDDQHVVWGICGRFSVTESFDVIDSAGLQNLLAQVPIRIKLRDPYLGILVDADVDLAARWQQLQSLLMPMGYTMPDKPDTSGTIVLSDEFQTIIGIWIMPDNQVPGMLEDFAELLIPKGDTALPYAVKVITEIQENTVVKFKHIHRSKALIHTWLAWQKIPGIPMGLAINKSYLDHNHQLCIMFVGWLNKLFNSNEQVETK